MTGTLATHPMLSQAIPDGGRNRLREKAYAPLDGPCRRAPRSHFFNLGARPVLCASEGGHHDDARGIEPVRLRESGGRSARGTGMMAGSDSLAVAGGLARHVPVLARPA